MRDDVRLVSDLSVLATGAVFVFGLVVIVAFVIGAARDGHSVFACKLNDERAVGIPKDRSMTPVILFAIEIHQHLGMTGARVGKAIQRKR